MEKWLQIGGNRAGEGECAPRRAVLREGMGDFFLSIASVDGGQRKGWIRTLYFEMPFTFSDLAQAVLTMERIMDELACPQLPSPIRRFREEERQKNQVSEVTQNDLNERLPLFMPSSDRKSLASFWLRILYRENSSWQGEIIWKNENERMYFRSVLELMDLMESAVQWAVDSEKGGVYSCGGRKRKKCQ